MINKELIRHLEELVAKPELQQAYLAGYDCGKNGANTTNCHFRNFATPEHTEMWEKGKADGEAAK